jgi:membrane protein
MKFLIKDLYSRFLKDDIPAIGTQMAYYFILSFFPLLIFIISLIGRNEAINNEIIDIISFYLPQSSEGIIKKILLDIIGDNNKTVLTFGIFSTLWISSRGIGAAIKGLNRAYDVKEYRPYWKISIWALFYTICLSLIITITFLIIIFGKYIGIYISHKYTFPLRIFILWDKMRYILIFIIMIITFIAFYSHTPNRKLTYLEVLPGTIFTSVGWIIASILFGYYVNNIANYSKIYGSLGGIIILLVWIYIVAEILLLGGEINAVVLFNKKKKIDK